MISTHLEYFIFILLALWKAKLVSKTSEIINILPHNKYFAMKIPMLSSFLIYFLPRSVIYHLKCIWLFGICNTIPPIFSLELSVMFYGRIKRCLEKRHWNAQSVNIWWKHKTKSKTSLQKLQLINNEHSYRYQINICLSIGAESAFPCEHTIKTLKNHTGPRFMDVNSGHLSLQFTDCNLTKSEYCLCYRLVSDCSYQ